MISDLFPAALPGSVPSFKQKYSKCYCSHGHLLPLSKKHRAIHDKEMAKLLEEAAALAAQAKSFRCKR